MRKFFLLVLALTGCSDSLLGPTLLGASDPIPGIEVSLAVAPSSVSAGDSIFFDASAFNPTQDDVRIAESCGPVFDVVIIDPDGAEVSVLAELLGPNGAFTCEGHERFIAEPMETESLRLAWVAHGRTGTYAAVAGLRWNSGLRHHSGRVAFQLR